MVLLALLTRALTLAVDHLAQEMLMDKNEQSEHSEDRAVNVSKALTFTTRDVLIACQGWV